ncbi:MAG: thiolase domain-containing protein [Gammaproteobacteria bacterium]|nr:thiolase domain-containing protein [Gammaproteobacteria bacterium]
MKSVYLIGSAQSPVASKGEPHLGQLGAEVVRSAMIDAAIDPDRAESLHVGNMLSGALSNQLQLGSLIADYANLQNIEAHTCEAACASGAVAARAAFLRVSAGSSDVAVACGVEAMTVAPNAQVTRALAAATDWKLEGEQGETFVSINANLMRMYRQKYNIDDGAFATFSVNAHRNASTNPNAVLRKGLDLEQYLSSRRVVDPLRLYDISPICSGAAAIVFGSESVARDALRNGRPLIRVIGSATATDAPALKRRADPLRLRAIEVSVSKALKQANVDRRDIDLFELHDAYTIMAALTLEAAGFAEPGAGVHFASDEEIGLSGKLPISTFGGLKARGHPIGATGIYQFVEAMQQLAWRSGPNQVPGATIALLQNIGGIAATVTTHVLRRED